jgi:UDP-N-acetylglucosamine 4,6-dehydratase
MKRIPECEAQPRECLLTNVMGSANVAWAAQSAGVKLVIGISHRQGLQSESTCYGASKATYWRVDLACADLHLPTRFTLCRYGNVLGIEWQCAATVGTAAQAERSTHDHRCTMHPLLDE